MKRALLIILMTAGLASAQSIPGITIHDANYVSLDSLLVADTISASKYRGSLTNSAYVNDTVTVTGIVIADPRVIRNVATRFSFYIMDTANGEWGGINVFTNDTSDNVINAGYGSVDTGYVIQVTGKVTKYGTDIWGNFELISTADATHTGDPLSVSDIKSKRPEPIEIKLSDLVSGDVRSGGKAKFSSGVKYKGAYVIVRNVTVKDVSQNSGSKQYFWTVEDDSGNTIGTYDISKYFSARPGYAVNLNWQPPASGSKLNYLRGILLSYSSYGFEIVPIYPGDIGVGSYTPNITATGFQTRRSAAFPAPTESDTVRIKAINMNPNYTPVDSAAVYYSVNTGAYARVKMTADTGNTFSAVIPPQADGSLVKYFFKAWSTDTLVSMAPDTARAPLFYYVRSGNLRTKDVQYTPFSDGVSGAIDLPVTLSGIVQADTSDYPAEVDHRSQAIKTPYVYIQDSRSPWSGIMLYDSLAYKLHRGDSVSVTGTVSEFSGMTEITVTSATVIASGKSTYPPVNVKTGDVGGKAGGTPSAEQWESMLIRFDSVTVMNNDPDPGYSITTEYGSFREYTISDGSGECRVDDDGSNMYSPDPHDTTWGFKIIPQGAFIQSLTGELKYANGNYKLEPRTDADFGEITGVRREPNIIPVRYTLEQNYPNPFNPATTIRYSVPRAAVVSLKIYNVLGQEVATLINQRQAGGSYSVSFNASRFASGVYFYRLSAGDFSSVKKMLLLK